MITETDKIVNDFVRGFRKDNPQVPERVVIAAVAVNIRRNQEYELVAFRRTRKNGIDEIDRAVRGLNDIIEYSRNNKI